MSNTVNISKLSVTDQVRNLPNPLVEEFKKLFESGEITMAMMLVMLQEKGLIAEGVKYMTFYMAMTKIYGFKQIEQQSHGFLVDYPQHMKLWDYEKNSAENLDPAKLTLGSKKLAWFKCPKNLHNSEKRRISHHTSGRACSKCRDDASAIANSIPKKGRSLAEMYPLVAAEYEAGGNEIPASDVAARSNKVIGEFIPSCGNPLHRPYSQRVCDRTRNEDRWIEAGSQGSWCPWCSNKNVSKFHGEVCEFISNLIPVGTGIDVLINQMVLPDDPSLPEGARQGNEVDFLSWDLGLAVEIHGYDHDYDPEGYTDSKAQRAKELGLDFYVVYIREWNDPERRKELEDSFKVLIGSRVIKHLKKQNRSVSGTFWNGSDEA